MKNKVTTASYASYVSYADDIDVEVDDDAVELRNTLAPIIRFKMIWVLICLHKWSQWSSADCGP